MIELQNSSNFRANIEIHETNIEENSESFDEFEDDFLNELEIEQTPIYFDILNEAENSYYGLGDSLQDYPEALKLYKHVIRLGGIEAYSRVGQMYMGGEGCSVDFKTALNYLKEGVSKGNEICYYYMGELFSKTENELNMNKCFKKYFLSSTFIEDKQNKVIGTDRISNVILYLSLVTNDIDDIDSEILAAFKELRQEIDDSLNKNIEFYTANPDFEILIDPTKRKRKKLFDLLNKI